MLYTPPVLPMEDERVAALRRLDILDTPEEVSFDDVTRLAAHITGRPIALVSLVDSARQWFKSRVGLDATETSREVSFCAHAIAQEEPIFEVADARTDTRFATNPLVVGEPNIGAYAGAKLRTPDGHAVGTLCVIDRQSCHLTSAQADALLSLARVTESMLGQRQLLKELGRTTERAMALERTLRSYTGAAAWATLDDLTRSSASAFVLPEREQTYVFADLSGFTRLSGELTTMEVTEALNTRLGPAADAVYLHGGDVEKFMGDALFAVFDTNSAALAFALDVQRVTAAAEPIRGERLPFTVGVHRGQAIRANIGSAGRRDNTLIGEAVNVAARLQGACPPGGILVSEAALAGLASPPTGERLTLTLKGVQKPVTATLLIGT